MKEGSEQGEADVSSHSHHTNTQTSHEAQFIHSQHTNTQTITPSTRHSHLAHTHPLHSNARNSQHTDTFVFTALAPLNLTMYGTCTLNVGKLTVSFASPPVTRHTRLGHATITVPPRGCHGTVRCYCPLRLQSVSVSQSDISRSRPALTPPPSQVQYCTRPNSYSHRPRAPQRSARPRFSPQTGAT